MRIVRITVFAAWSVLVVIALVSLINRLGLMPPQSPLFGADYIPALWLFVLSLPVAALLAVTGRRLTALCGAAAFSVFLLLFGDLSFARRPKVPAVHHARDLSVLALNVRYYSHGVATIADFIRTVEPDVALLCENRIRHAQKAELHQRLPGYHILLGRQEETAVCSKLPVVTWSEVDLPTFQASLSKGNDINAVRRRGVRRSFVHAIVDLNGTHVHVISLRLIAGRAKTKSLTDRYQWGRYLLESQMAEVTFLENYLSRLDGPVVFGGDLNAPPSSRPIRVLSRIAVDSYLETHTYGGLTFRCTLPTMRLDYILHSPEFVTLESSILPDVVSDHFPVFVTLRLTSPVTKVASIPNDSERPGLSLWYSRRTLHSALSRGYGSARPGVPLQEPTAVSEVNNLSGHAAAVHHD